MVVLEPKETPTRVKITKEELETLTKEQLVEKWLQQEIYIDHLEGSSNESAENSELVSLRESEEKLKQQQLEATRRENVLVMRLTTKEQEMQEYAHQIQELKSGQVQSASQLRSALLDPAVNLLFERMKKELETTRAKLEETQNELSAWKFTPDSNTGKRLMAKCRLLYQENEELGKIISEGRVAKLEGDLALQRTFTEEMKKSQSEQDEFLVELDEEVEGMQTTIYYLQQQLREAKEEIVRLQQGDQRPSGGVNVGSSVNGVPVASVTSQKGAVRSPASFQEKQTKEPLVYHVKTEVESDSERELSIDEYPNKFAPKQHEDRVPQTATVKVSYTSSDNVVADVKQEPFGQSVVTSVIKETFSQQQSSFSMSDTSSEVSTIKETSLEPQSPSSASEKGFETPISKDIVAQQQASLPANDSSVQQQKQTVPVNIAAINVDAVKKEPLEQHTKAAGNHALAEMHVQKTSPATKNVPPVCDAKSEVTFNKETAIHQQQAPAPVRQTVVTEAPTRTLRGRVVNKRKATTKGGARTRKRVREESPPETPVVEESPAIFLQRQSEMSSVTDNIQVDTDTEVQVAETLACWAVVNKERQQEMHEHVQDQTSDSMGNGDIDVTSVSASDGEV